MQYQYTYKLNVAYFIIPKAFWYSEPPCTTSTICHLETSLAVFQRCLSRYLDMIIIVPIIEPRARKFYQWSRFTDIGLSELPRRHETQFLFLYFLFSEFPSFFSWLEIIILPPYV